MLCNMLYNITHGHATTILQLAVQHVRCWSATNEHVVQQFLPHPNILTCQDVVQQFATDEQVGQLVRVVEFGCQQVVQQL